MELQYDSDEPHEYTLCTGFFIGRHTVITNGHCLYDHKNHEFVAYVVVIPGLDDEEAPFGYETVTAVVGRTVHVLQPYIDTPTGDPNYDFGAVILPNDDLGSKVGSLKYGHPIAGRPLRDRELQNLDIFLAGYPGEVNGVAEGYTAWNHHSHV